MKYGGSIKNENGLKTYYKFEKDTNAIFKIDNSLSINSKMLEKCDVVVVSLMYLNKKLSATKEEIKKHNVVRTFNRETKYYLPLDKWKEVK